jgi:hypothetical protein
MRELRTSAALGLTIAALATLSIVALARPSASAAPLPPMMTADELKQFGIVQVADVTDDPSVVAPPALPSAQAIDLAAKHLGRSDRNVRLLHGSAKPIYEQPARSVWIVLFTGGNLPVLGPPGASRPVVPIRFTGVELDDQSGEVLTWFMH